LNSKSRRDIFSIEKSLNQQGQKWYVPVSRNIQLVEIFEQQGQKRNPQYREIFEPLRSEVVCSNE
jgi:hypothetical protein